MSLQQLTFYLNKFRTRLTPAHGLHLRRLLRFLNALRGLLEKWKVEATRGQDALKQEMMAANSLMAQLGSQVDGINLLEIEAYLKRSKIARKIHRYIDKAAEKAAGQGL